MTETVGPDDNELQPQDWIALGSGFTRLWWSIPIGLLLFSGALEFRIFDLLRLPSYVIAVGLYCWGLVILLRASPPTARWRRLIRVSFVLALLLLYFAPFLYWWQWRPASDHFAVNIFAMLFTISFLLWTLNQLVEEIAYFLHDGVFLAEARLCRWSVALFMFAPLMAYFIHGVWNATRYGLPLGQYIDAVRFLPFAHWILAMFILPLTLTLTMVWKVKSRAWRALAAAQQISAD